MPDSKWSASQEKAITYGTGPLLVLAGPGSGKTFTLVERVCYLINQNQIPPEHILVLTFTKAAAAEMKNRFLRRSQHAHEGVTFGTFHAIYYHMLRSQPAFRQCRLPSAREKEAAMDQILQRHKEWLAGAAEGTGAAGIAGGTEAAGIAGGTGAAEITGGTGAAGIIGGTGAAGITGGTEAAAVGRTAAASMAEASIEQIRQLLEACRLEKRRRFLPEEAPDTAAALPLAPAKRQSPGTAAALPLAPAKRQSPGTAAALPLGLTQRQFATIVEEYEEMASFRHWMDYDDMVLECLRLLQENEPVRAAWQRQYTHLLVDEFQDISPLQYQVVRLLAAPQDNLFAVGDDDQSIYGFRGAAPACMQRFLQDYPQAGTVVLQENYRSSPQIVRLAGQVIRQNTNRLPKEQRAVAKSQEPVRLYCFSSRKEQADWLTARLGAASHDIRGSQDAGTGQGTEAYQGAGTGQNVGAYHDAGTGQGTEAYHDAGTDQSAGTGNETKALLVRTNRQGAWWANALALAGISFRMTEPARCLYDHFVATDLFAYLRFACEGRARKDFLQIMNRPVRYLRRECLREKVVDWECLRAYYAGKEYMQQILRRFQLDTARLARLPLQEAVAYVLGPMGYEDYLREKLAPEEAREAWDAVAQLREAAGHFPDLRAWESYAGSLRSALGGGRQLREYRPAKAKEAAAIDILTLHGCKGLEFDTVYLPDVNEGSIPYRRAAEAEALEEERRLFYVGLTRAKRTLVLSCIKKEQDPDGIPSRFLQKLTALERISEEAVSQANPHKGRR